MRLPAGFSSPSGALVSLVTAALTAAVKVSSVASLPSICTAPAAAASSFRVVPSAATLNFVPLMVTPLASLAAIPATMSSSVMSAVRVTVKGSFAVPVPVNVAAAAMAAPLAGLGLIWNTLLPTVMVWTLSGSKVSCTSAEALVVPSPGLTFPTLGVVSMGSGSVPPAAPPPVTPVMVTFIAPSTTSASVLGLAAWVKVSWLPAPASLKTCPLNLTSPLLAPFSPYLVTKALTISSAETWSPSLAVPVAAALISA